MEEPDSPSIRLGVQTLQGGEGVEVMSKEEKWVGAEGPQSKMLSLVVKLLESVGGRCVLAIRVPNDAGVIRPGVDQGRDETEKELD